MEERIVTWCHCCSHESAFEIKGTCIQRLNPYDEAFPELVFIEREYTFGEIAYEKEIITYPRELQEEVENEYTFQKAWTFMQCLTCLQPMLIEKRTLDTKPLINEWDVEAEYEPDESQIIREFKSETEVLYPANKIESIATPHKAMPAEVANIFNEARAVFENSPRASAALLRLALQVLLKGLNLPGSSINDDIKILIQSKQLSNITIQALDSIRIMGNNAVHPGEIDLNEDSQTTIDLFYILNYIVAHREIIQRIGRTYKKTPENQRNKQNTISKTDGFSE